MIFISINKKQKIIADTGYFKCELLLLGMILCFLSINFNCFSSYLSCSMNFYLKHGGILIIYSILLVYIYTGYRLGMDFKEINTLNLDIFKTNSLETKDEQNLEIIKKQRMTQIKKTIMINIEQELMSMDNYNALDLLNSQNNLMNFEKELNYWCNKANNNFNNNSDDGEDDKNKKRSSNDNKSFSNDDIQQVFKKLNKSISYVHSLYLEIIILYFICCITILLLIIFNSLKEKEYIQEYNGKWKYQCPLIHYDIIADLTESLLMLYIIILATSIWNYTFIFKCIKYIGYSSITWFTLGPLVNVRIIIFDY